MKVGECYVPCSGVQEAKGLKVMVNWDGTLARVYFITNPWSLESLCDNILFLIFSFRTTRFLGFGTDSPNLFSKIRKSLKSLELFFKGRKASLIFHQYFQRLSLD